MSNNKECQTILSIPLLASVLIHVFLLLPTGVDSFSTTKRSFSASLQQRERQSSTLLLASVSNKGFGSKKGSTTVESNDDKKRKNKIDGLDQWAKSVGIA